MSPDAYQPRHGRAGFPTEPQPATTADKLAALGADPGRRVIMHDYSQPGSVFDAPPADLTYAKAKARALIAEFEIWVNSPGVAWDDAASGAWMGQACTILAELAK